MKSLMRLAEHRLDDGIRDLVGKELAERVAAAEFDPDADEAILASVGAYVLSRHMPGDILRDLRGFCAADGHVMTLGNLPAQQFPDTPVSGFGEERQLAVVNALQFGLIQMLGITPFAVRYENDGRLIRNVVPNPASSGVASSWGADSEFSWHTDNPHLPFGAPGLDPRPYVPRYLTFYVVRNDEHVPTEVATVDDVITQLDGESVRRLRSAQFAVGAPASNDADPSGRHRLFDETAVLGSGPDGRAWARYDPGTTEGRTARARAAIKAWSGAVERASRQEFVLQPGDFLIFDNYRVLHRRRAFIPRPESTARWLRRCYAS